MRRLSVLPAVLVIVALVTGPLSALASTGKTHEVKATIVSMDAKAKTVTIKMENGEKKTVPVMGQAINKMKNLKPGEHVTCVCTDKESGEHEGISDFKTEHQAAHKK